MFDSTLPPTSNTESPGADRDLRPASRVVVEHPLVRAGQARALRGDLRTDVHAQAVDGEQALAQARVRDDANRQQLAIRRLLRDMTTNERRLERAMLAFEANEHDTVNAIESNSRAEHWGKEPERPWAWRAASNGAVRQRADTPSPRPR